MELIIHGRVVLTRIHEAYHTLQMPNVYTSRIRSSIQQVIFVLKVLLNPKQPLTSRAVPGAEYFICITLNSYVFG